MTFTFSLAEANIERIDKQTASTDNAGLQSLVKIDKQIWPLLYTWGCKGILSPTKITIGESKGYLALNLKFNLNVSPS